MAIYSYVLVDDTGFAPNPYGSFLTLATCKPKIRASAGHGDWIVGTGAKHGVGSDRVVYAALIETIVPLEVYGSGSEFREKIPRVSGEEWQKHGDNIYFRTDDGEWAQRRNPHHREGHIGRDLKGRNVLISRNFWYFGEKAPRLPEHLLGIVKTGPGHKRITDPSVEVTLSAWLSQKPPGMTGEPSGRPKPRHVTTR